MRLEQTDRRVLGAVRFLDTTTQWPVITPLRVESETATVSRNRAGLYILRSAAGLEAHVDAFEQPPAAPPMGSIKTVLTVADPSGQFLRRRCSVLLPRDPDPTKAEQGNSLFQAAEFRLFPAPAARTASGAAVIRASVSRKSDGSALAGALLRVLRSSDSALLASGLSDARGEALVLVPGIPVITFDSGAGPVIAKDTAVSVQAVFDPNAGGIPDPDDLEARKVALPSATVAASLSSGGVLVLKMAVVVP